MSKSDKLGILKMWVESFGGGGQSRVLYPAAVKLGPTKFLDLIAARS